MADEVNIVIENEIDEIYIDVFEAEQVNVVVQDGVGPRGFSAYEVALQNGFVGTEAEWLASLQSDIIKSVDEPVNPPLNQLWIPL